MTENIHKHPELVKALGVEISELGAVMLRLEPFPLFTEETKRFIREDDLYTSPNPDRWWINGDVTDILHVTLLYGLLTPAWKQERLVELALDGWKIPTYFRASAITTFDSSFEDEPYKAIVAELNVFGDFDGGSYDNILLFEANQRLSYLPHINTYPSYKPHVTLAYVKEEVAEGWIEAFEWVFDWDMQLFKVDQSNPIDLGRRDD